MQKGIVKTRYLRITETRGGRVIEAWVREPKLLLDDKSATVKSEMRPWMVVSMFGWGAMGIFIGNLLVGYII